MNEYQSLCNAWKVTIAVRLEEKRTEMKGKYFTGNPIPEIQKTLKKLDTKLSRKQIRKIANDLTRFRIFEKKFDEVEGKKVPIYRTNESHRTYLCADSMMRSIGMLEENLIA